MHRKKLEGCEYGSIERWIGAAMSKNKKKVKKRSKSHIKPHNQQVQMLSLVKEEMSVKEERVSSGE